MSDDDEFRQMLAALSAEFRGELPERLAAINTLWDSVVAGRHDAAQMDELIRAVHKIAGSAGTFGLAALGDAAAAMEARLEPYRGTAQRLDDVVREDITGLLNQLRQAVSGGV